MKLFKIILIFLSFTVISSANTNVIVNDYYHPQSEPRGLYIVDFTYDNSYYTYRMYCPTGMVRDITGGSWGKDRKAYQEDRIYFGGARVVRSAFDAVCR